MENTASAFDRVLESVRAALHARRADVAARAQQIERALALYVAAEEARLALEFAREHGLRRPDVPSVTSLSAARALFLLVQALPELAGTEQRALPQPSPAPAREAAPAAAEAARGQPPALGAPPAPPVATDASPAALRVESWPRLERAVLQQPLVIVGGVSKRERLAMFAEPVRANVEWIDTTRQGTHAIGNLERRIREHRLSALIVLDGILSHRHSDPLLSAARQVGLPCAYAGKGGKGALARALSEIETTLSRAETNPP